MPFWRSSSEGTDSSSDEGKWIFRDAFFFRKHPRSNRNKRSTGTFPTGLPDGESMFENLPERPDLADV